MPKINTEGFKKAVKANEAAVAKRESEQKQASLKSVLASAVKMSAPAPKPFRLSRKALNTPGQARAHWVYDVPAEVPYSRALEPDFYRAVASDLRVGDWVELRWAPGLQHFAVMLVTNLLPLGVDVIELYSPRECAGGCSRFRRAVRLRGGAER